MKSISNNLHKICRPETIVVACLNILKLKKRIFFIKDPLNTNLSFYFLKSKAYLHCYCYCHSLLIGTIFLQTIPIPVQAQRVLMLYFCFFSKDDKAHNVHDKDVHRYIIKIQSRNLTQIV